MAKLKYLLASLLVISATLLSASGVSASTFVSTKELAQEKINQDALDSYDGANISSGGRSYYSVTYSGNGGEIDLGDMTAPRQLNYLF